MKPANDNKLPAGATLDGLPLFATDMQIAVAIVGKARAGEWLAHSLPALEARGFPPIDRLHQGRPVPSVKEYYQQYLGLSDRAGVPRPHGEERIGQWKSTRRRG